MFIRHARNLILASTGTILVGLATTACTSQNTSTAPASTTPTTPAAIASSTTTPTTTSMAATPTTSHRKSADTVLFAQLVGYDATNRMIKFRSVIRYPSTVKQDDYGFDPKDPAVHQLPLAPPATVAGLGGGGSQICRTNPPDQVAQCSTDQLITVLERKPTNPLIAQLVVSSSDTITTVAEQIGTLHDPAGE